MDAAQAKTLSVGSGQPFQEPSKAIAAAEDGDTIEIAPGEYFDCAIIGRNNLTIVGTGPGVVLTDKTCESKALLVTRGHSITIRNLTLTRARVADGNGAGIRAEGSDLTIEQTRFINNQAGILAGDQPQSTIRITDSLFEQNGRCDEGRCAHGVAVGRIALLHIEQSKFLDPRGGHQIMSAASRTELVGDDIEDGPKGASSYLVEIPSGGALVMRNDKLEKGPQSTNRRAAVMIGDGSRSQPTTELTFAHNDFVDDTHDGAAFVLNWSEADAKLEGNHFTGDVTPVSSQGYLWHSFRQTLAWIKSSILDVARLLKHAVSYVLHH